MINRLIYCFQLLFLLGLSGPVMAQSLPVPQGDKNPVVLGNKRITLITPTLIRLEYAENREFLDDPTMFAYHRDALMTEGYTITPKEGGKQYEISTGKVRLVIDNDNLPFGQINTKIYFTRWGKEKVATGRNLHSKKRNLNLGGSLTTLDAVYGEVPLQDGLLSEDGWYYVIDTGTEVLKDGWFTHRKPTHVQDQYCFVYGDDFHAPFRDLGVISGKVPMTRRYQHGVWYSRWYPYDDAYINTLVSGYKENGFPLDILSMDMDWHTQDAQVGIGHNFTKGWSGHTWNRKLIPNPAGLIARLKADSIFVCVNEHPHDGILPNEECYGDFMRAMGHDPAKKESLLFNLADRKYIENYLKYTRRENRKLGVAFWWVDWQQDYLYPYVRGTHMSNLSWLNKLFYEDTEQGGMRGAGYSRWGGWGSHRYPINFSGDAAGNWDMLKFEVKLSQTSGNAGCYYWAHDIGGFHGGTNPELLVRWSQFGALSAALRVHAARGPKLDRRPWLWGDQATKAMRVAYGFRSQMMPYIYSSVRTTHETMLPLNRCMVVDYAADSMAYRRYGQFMLGELLLAAPITHAGVGGNKLASTEVWFPQGNTWWDYFTDECHQGGVVDAVAKDIYTFPVFVKGGHVLPMQPFSYHPASASLSTLVMRVYPGQDGDNNSFTLYEDDGLTQEYVSGRFAKTRLSYRQTGRSVTVEVAPTEGEYDGQLSRRGYRLELAGFTGIGQVKVNGKNVKAVKEGYRWYLDIKPRSIRQATIVKFNIEEK